MDYYRQAQAVTHGQAVQPAYVYPTATSAGGNAGMYYQHAMGSYAQQPSPYSMQPSVSQGGSGLVGQSGVGGNGARRSVRSAQDQGIPNMTHHARLPNQTDELPFRMVVDSKYVGAIIGQGGSKIREVTKDTKARCIVDANKGMRDAHGGSEKVIIINGTPDSTSKAVVRILEVVVGEKEKEREKEDGAGDSEHEVELKLRANNQLVGRLIGKQGATIKKIMTDTATNISVSNEQSNPSISALNQMHPVYAEMMLGSERTITVKAASIDAISQAEQKISAKLKQAHDYDVVGRVAAGSAYPMAAPFAADPYALMAVEGMRNQNQHSFKNVRMFVPNNMVGAIIGSKGSYIRSIMRTTGAHIRIDGNEKRGEKGSEEDAEKEKDAATDKTTAEEKKETTATDEGAVDGEGEKKDEERLVTIGGSDQQIYRAQFAVFSKVAEQGAHYGEETKLRSEVSVPSRLVGRIIGKGGQNVRELQRVTGAMVKIAEDSNPELLAASLENAKIEEKKEGESHAGAASSSTNSAVVPADAETTVRIFGNIYATIGAQSRISMLIADYNRGLSHADRPNGGSAPATSSSQEA